MVLWNTTCRTELNGIWHVYFDSTNKTTLLPSCAAYRNVLCRVGNILWEFTKASVAIVEAQQ